ncbi:baseplate J/gp47 family protein [Methylobacterium sp. NMS14P]|uniref:baseplate J/gp47 family protein n=1 Tax=Methylobacterium sp. NMS14P TaxID=2894310 RepID=UPI00235879AA|nr:baseplate J/gp47 family protein [Methylobacterium sp. NMS14P]WCS27223.1 baseplate J/gp47 family protein [Methylobacterium sp. NMS14P]
MGTTPVGTITAAGFARPAFSYCLDYRQSGTRAIYGQDLYLGEDCQDGQIEVFNAQGIFDVSGVALDTYSHYSPSGARGAGLSSLVKINGLARKVATNSTCDFLQVGQAGTAVSGGTVTDPSGNVWSLPDFLIPAAGQILVTGTCQVLGAVALAAGAVDTANGEGALGNVQRGWQSATNPSAAAPGQPVETDSQLRRRQAVSVALPSLSILGGLVGALRAVSGVTRLRAYENDTNQPDANGIPGKGIALVIDGGDAATIASVIALKKGAAGTWGSTVVPVTDDVGITRTIAFFRPTQVPITYALKVRPLFGYTSSVEAQIQQALSDWTNGLGIGNGVMLSRAYVPADLSDQPTGATFEIIANSLTVARDGVAPTGQDAVLAFNEAAICAPGNISISYAS